ncbi:MAG: hypothetical protein IJY39_12865 [Clostridia bacterium]|nr:hypothetical protein [Clostridia bacterium]
MITRKTGKELIKFSGILAILISIAIIVAIIADGKWERLFGIFSILAHITLLVVFYYSRQMEEYDFKKYMGIGIFAAICTGIQFYVNIYMALSSPSVWTLLYLLMLPVSILFMMGVTFYERGQKSEYDD